MRERRMSIEVCGQSKKWCFEVYADPRYLDDWRADGLVIHVIENTVPTWLPSSIKVRWWCFAQDLFNFRNPWRK